MKRGSYTAALKAFTRATEVRMLSRKRKMCIFVVPNKLFDIFVLVFYFDYSVE